MVCLESESFLSDVLVFWVATDNCAQEVEDVVGNGCQKVDSMGEYRWGSYINNVQGRGAEQNGCPTRCMTSGPELSFERCA